MQFHHGYPHYPQDPIHPSHTSSPNACLMRVQTTSQFLALRNRGDNVCFVSRHNIVIYYPIPVDNLYGEVLKGLLISEDSWEENFRILMVLMSISPSYAFHQDACLCFSPKSTFLKELLVYQPFLASRTTHYPAAEAESLRIGVDA